MTVIVRVAPSPTGYLHVGNARAALLNALLLTLRGSICLYQGEELGLPQAHVPFERLQDPEAIANWPLTLGRDGARTPMPWSAAEPHAGFSSGEPWLPIDPGHVALAVDMQQRDPGSVLHATRALLAIRRSHPALIDGEIEFLAAPQPMLLYERSRGGARVRCAFNLGATPVACDLGPGRWRVIAGGPADAAVPGAVLAGYGYLIATDAAG